MKNTQKKYLSDYAELMSEWHYKKNLGLNPNETTDGSSRKVWWKCANNHEWEARVWNRTKKGAGRCLECNGLSFLKPEVVKDWDYERNSVLPQKLSIYDERPFYWKCSEKGHIEVCSVANRVHRTEKCQRCARDFLIDNTDLMRYWDYENNELNKINLEKTTVGATATKVWWKCPTCNYKWKESPYEQNKRIKKCENCCNNFIKDDEYLMAYWDYEKNLKDGISIEDLTTGSDKEVHWKCVVCGLEEFKKIKYKKREKHCKQCSNFMANPEYNLTTKYPDILRFWDYELNKKRPENYLPNSNARVHFRCDKNSEHKWEGAINSEIFRDNCSFCKGRRAATDNNLTITHSYLLEEWDYEKNLKEPSEYTQTSKNKVFWICKRCNHSWHTEIYNRTKKLTGCSRCNGNSDSFPEYGMLYFFEKNGLETRHRIKSKYGEIDVFLPKLNLAIEYNGKHWHERTIDKDTEKFINLSKNFKVILVNEKGLGPYFEADNIYGIKEIIDRGDKNLEFIKDLFDAIGIPFEYSISKEDYINVGFRKERTLNERSIFHDEATMRYWNWELNETNNINPHYNSKHSRNHVHWKCPDCKDYFIETIVKVFDRKHKCLNCYSEYKENQRQLLKQRVVQLFKEGYTLDEVSLKLNIHKKTVRKYYKEMLGG